MHKRQNEKLIGRCGLSHKGEIALRTAVVLYSRERSPFSWFLLDLIVLLAIFLFVMHAQFPKPSVVRPQTAFPFITGSVQERAIERAHEQPYWVLRRLIPENRRAGSSNMNPLLKEAGPYLSIISDAAAINDVKKSLILAVIKVESGFDPWAVSRQGAMGLMQLMPMTAMDLGVENPFDPEENIHGGVAYLSYCIRKFNDVKLALAAYNAGPGLVSKLNQIPSFKETRDFVQDVLRHKTDYDPIIS